MLHLQNVSSFDFQLLMRNEKFQEKDVKKHEIYCSGMLFIDIFTYRHTDIQTIFNDNKKYT